LSKFITIHTIGSAVIINVDHIDYLLCSHREIYVGGTPLKLGSSEWSELLTKLKEYIIDDVK
jgi:hypothetical protein